MRAPLPPRPLERQQQRVVRISKQPSRGHLKKRGSDASTLLKAPIGNIPTGVTPTTATMSRGNFGGRTGRIEPLTWMTNVTVGVESRDSSEGRGSGGANSIKPSTGSSQSKVDAEPSQAKSEQRSNSRSREEAESNQLLQNEWVCGFRDILEFFSDVEFLQGYFRFEIARVVKNSSGKGLSSFFL